MGKYLEICNQDDLEQLRIKHCNELWSKRQALKIEILEDSTGKWGMAKLWRSWMKVTADFMAAQGSVMPLMVGKDGKWFGSRPFNSDDAHELFTSQWLGVDKEGARLSWAKRPHDGMRPADKGERFLAMQKHQSWCVEKGINLPVPKNSEYYEMENENV